MYHRVATYPGPMAQLAALSGAFDFAWIASGYGVTSNSKALRDAYADDLADVFPGEWADAMLVVIRPGGNIRVHKDVMLRDGIERHHLVLQTNDLCYSLHGGDWQQLEPGGIYTMEPGVDHASINFGDLPRVHLVIDCAPVRGLVFA